MARFQRTTVDNSPEKDILIGAIVSDTFLEQTTPLLKHLNLIKEPSIRITLSWCLDFYKEYNHAPRHLIADIVRSRQNELDEKNHQIIQNIIEHVNDRYIQNEGAYSDAYYIKKAKKYIEEQSLIKLSEDIRGNVETGRLDQAKRILINYNRVDPVISTGVDPINDPLFLATVFAKMKTGLIKFPYDALQELFRDVYRGDIVAVAGPAKRGKSFLMSQIGRYALHSKLNVAEFSYEMDDSIMGMRLYTNLIGQTRREQKEVTIPYFDENGNVKYDFIDYNGIDYSEAADFQKMYSRFSDIGHLRFFDHNSCGRKVGDIADALDRLERYEGIKADVVVIDYDMLLEPESNADAYDGGINQIWKDVKAKIAQDRDTLVVFGSQYNKQGAKYEVGPQEASHSSRKFDYVSHWVSILQTEAEKKAGIMRLSMLGRHDEFHQSDKVVCLQSLALSRPIMDARWMKDIPNYDEVVQEQQKLIDQFKIQQEQENKKEEGGKIWRQK